MKRPVTLLVILLTMGIMAAPVTANHGSGHPTNKKECEEQGGNWFNDNGEKTCVFVEPGGGETTVTVNLNDEEVDIAWEVWAEADIREDEEEDEFVVVFEAGSTQRGNIGVRGTRETHRLVNTCRVEGGSKLLPERECEWVRALDTSDQPASIIRIRVRNDG